MHRRQTFLEPRLQLLHIVHVYTQLTESVRIYSAELSCLTLGAQLVYTQLTESVRIYSAELSCLTLGAQLVECQTRT